MKPLNIVLPCWKGDQHQAEWLLEWIAEMGLVQAPFFLLCSKECKVDRLMELARKAFSSATFLPDGENLQSNWHEEGDHPKSAAGPNSLFRQAAWHFSLKQLGPWFFLEPDAVPCRRDWYDMLVKEYQIGGKPFMGYKVTPQNHPGVPDHLSGVAIYPENTPNFRNLVFPSDVAFDIAGVDHTMAPNAAHCTQVIYHKYRADGFTSEEDFNARVPEHVAVWHACKDGSIYPYLKNRLGITSDTFVARVPVSGLTVTSAEERGGVATSKEPLPSAGSNPAACDIFIKTRPHDYPWLEWCLKSIHQNTDGFRTTIIRSDNGEAFNNGHIPPNTRYISADERSPGYLWQQVCKLHADEHTDAEWILFMDSDCVFTRPVSPSDFIREGKPIWLYTPLDQARPDQHVWAPVMEKFLGRNPQHEFMRRHPFIVQRWMLEEFRKFTQYRHGKSLEEYIMGEADPGNGLALRFSEWNCLGFFMWEFHRDKVNWVLDSEAPPACVYQGFTHGGEQRKQEDLAKFQELLAGQPEEGNIASGVAPDGSKVTSSGEGGRDLTVSSAIAFLCENATDNAYKARVIRKLKSGWKGKGEPPRKRSAGISEQKNGHSVARAIRVAAKAHEWDEALLCIHSYPGANDTVARHWRSYEKFGADRIVGIGTLDNKTTFPCESVNIGEDGYMKLKGKDDHLCRRLLDTVKWCLAQPEDRFAIIEYDTIPLRKMPKWKGVNASLTGGQVNDSKARSFYHNPWLFDRTAGEKLVCAMEAVLPESAEYPNNSPDLFFGLACERAGIRVECKFTLFTRNSLDAPGDLDLAVEAAVNGAHVIHGVKEAFEYDTIMNALNGKHLALSQGVMFLPHLSELGELYGTDKYSLHRYTDFYHELLSPLRHEKITLLEIGVLGGESLKMWEAFFGHPLSVIYGVDIHDRSIPERERMKVRIGDGSSKEFIDQLVQETGPLDIVVDDGSHYSDQQKRSLECLWPHLRPGGLYICEDTHSSYHYPWTRPDEISFVNSLMDWIHRLNEHGAGHCGIPTETDIEQITFRKSVVVLRKR